MTADQAKSRYDQRKAARECIQCGRKLNADHTTLRCHRCLEHGEATFGPTRRAAVTPVRQQPTDDTVQYFERTGRKYVVRINDYYFGTIYCSTDELYTADEVGVLGRMLACPMDHVPAKQRTALEQAVRENREGT